MTTIGIIAILVGIVFISIEQKKGILMILGGSFIGIGSNPINLGMIILGFGLLGLSIKLILEDKKNGKTAKGIIEEKWIEQYKKEDDGYISKQFDFKIKNAKETPKQRYTIDIASMNRFANLGMQLAAGNINRGLQMQNEQGPQKDWAIAGGIADGLFGGGAGAAVALKTMQDNMEATRKHHETGKRMVKDGIKNIKRIDESMKGANKLAKEINKTDNFEYTDVMPKLIKCFEFVSVSIISNETKTMYKANSLGKVEQYQLNELTAYNSLVFFKAKYKIKNNFHEMYPEHKEKEIDGAFKISLYDGEQEIAYSYIFGDNWSVNDLKNAGFKAMVEGNTTFKLIDSNIKIIPSKNYTAKFSEPNLWLVNPK